MAESEEVKIFECTECGYRYTSEAELKEHFNSGEHSELQKLNFEAEVENLFKESDKQAS